MEKRLVLKKQWVAVIIILVILILVRFLSKLDEIDYNKAVDKCNGSQNVVTKYTSTGDKYYTCKAR